MSQLQHQKTVASSSNTNDYLPNYEKESEPNVEETRTISKIWSKPDKLLIGKVLKDESRNVSRTEAARHLRNPDAVCLYRFSSNYDGVKCTGYVYGGVCLYHWQQMGISFTNANYMVLDDLDTGASRAIVDQITPYFISPHGKEYCGIAPIIRSIRREDWCSDKNQLVSLISPTYMATSREEATAMAKGLLTLVFANNPDITTIRNSWLDTQKQLIRTLDPNNIYQLIIQKENGESTIDIVKLDDLSIFDSPILLAIPSSALMSANGKSIFSNPANITMIQTAPPRTIGVFTIIGPVLYAPLPKRVLEDIGKKQGDNRIKQNRQHVMVFAKLAGKTESSKPTLLPLQLSQNSVYIMNISESRSFDSKYWESLDCDTLNLNNGRHSDNIVTSSNKRTTNDENIDEMEQEEPSSHKTFSQNTLVGL